MSNRAKAVNRGPCISSRCSTSESCTAPLITQFTIVIVFTMLRLSFNSDTLSCNYAMQLYITIPLLIVTQPLVSMTTRSDASPNGRRRRHLQA